jgi:RNA polymerase sigma factor (sigma-70 family)
VTTPNVLARRHVYHPENRTAPPPGGRRTEDDVAWQDDLAVFARERGPALVGYARLLTGELAAAEDLVQDAIVHTWSRRRSGGGVDALDAYVRRAILHRYVDGWRRERGWRDRARLIGETPPAESPERSAVDRTDVAVALTVLSPRERTCVVLRFYEDLTVPEIARRLDLSDGAVKRYLSDAMRRLAPLLGTPTDTPDTLTVTSTTTPKGERR